MISRTLVACRATSGSAAVLAAVACVAAALAPGASPAWAAGCPNEQLREESSLNPATGRPYSTGLPDCRAYEMVSPLYKQAHDATALFGTGGSRLLVAPAGDTVGFGSEGDFADPGNYKINAHPVNPYLSQRGPSGWITSSAFPPAKLLDLPSLNGLEAGDTSADLRSVRVACGSNNAGKGEVQGASGQYYGCTVHKLGGEWEAATPNYPEVGGVGIGAASTIAYLGASSDLSRVFVEPGGPLLPYDTLGNPKTAAAGIYEIAGVGTASPVLRLVNIDNEGNELKLEQVAGIRAPLFGNRGGGVPGTAYHAISESGETVFLTATPKGSETETLYARVPCVTGAHCRFVEEVDKEGRVVKEGSENKRKEPTGRETVAVSAPAPAPECTEACAASPPAPATFQGASADGSKVFFTTTQKLLNSDTNSGYDLYEYHFLTKQEEEEGKKRLILISGGMPSTETDGVVRSSPDGSHVYFAEAGVLTTEETVNENTWLDGDGVKQESKAEPGPNLYGYDTVTGETKFVAHTAFVAPKISEESEFEQRIEDEISYDKFRPAWTTPDGRFLVFSQESQSQLAGDLNKSTAQAIYPEAVYRYGFGEPGKPGELTWVSHGAPGFKVENEGEGKYQGEGRNAFVSFLPGTLNGGNANIDDWNRAVSGCPKGVSQEERQQCPAGKYDGETIVFATAEKLQAGDINGAPDVYEWHCASPCVGGRGTVSMISDGHDPQGIANQNGIVHGTFGTSASGSDIFFTTHSSLVAQDTDVLRDVYDARVEGGFPAPTPELSCSGDACQGTSSAAPSFGSTTSSLFTAEGNRAVLASQAVKPSPKPKPKPLTRAQKLAKALKACKGKPKKKRAVCESQARKKYGNRAKAKKSSGRGT